MKCLSRAMLLPIGMLIGCIGDVELQGKACPCLDTHVCDAVLDVCVELSSPGSGHPDAAVKPHDLRAEWTTSNSVRWRWDLGQRDDPDQLAGYRLYVAASEEGVLSQDGATIWAGNLEAATDALHINPELARYALPRTTGSDLLVATITDLHEPDRTLFARLIATDTAGDQWATNVAQARTTLPALPGDEVVLFSEADLPGLTIPNSYVRTAGEAYSGTYHYEWVNDTGLQFEGLRQQPAVPIDVSEVTEGDFENTAIFEIAVRYLGDAPSFWSELWIRFGGDFHAGIRGITFRNDDAYRLIQIPLRVLTENIEPAVLLEYQQLAQGVDEIDVGGHWTDQAVVRVDEARIRW